MKFKDGLRIAGRDLKRRKGRTFLTSLAVAIGTMLIVTLVSLGTSGEKLILSETENSSKLKQVQVANMKYFDPYDSDSSSIDESEMYKKIDNNTVKKFAGISGVSEAQAVINNPIDSISIDNKKGNSKTQIMSLYNNASSFSSESIDDIRTKNKDTKLQPIIAGRNLNKQDKDSILIGKKYLSSMGITNYKSVLGKDAIIAESKTKDPNIILKPIQIKGKIVGIINDKFEEENEIVTSIDLAGKIKNYYSLENDYIKNQGYDAVILSSKDMSAISDIGDAVKKQGYFYMSYQDVVKKIQNSFKIIKVILAVLGLIVLFVASVGIVNTMTMVIYERTKSIGIMKSIGANRHDIHSIFIIQSAVIGFIGGIIGILFSTINLNVIQFALKMYLKSKNITEVIKFPMPLWLAFGTLAFSIFISIISGIYPSRKASKMDPVQALNS